MDELTPNPDECPKFEQNPFKKEKCKHCGHPWTAHKGVIDPKIVDGYIQAKQKVAEDKEKAAAKAKAEAAAKKLAKKTQEQAVEDAWLFDGAQGEQDNAAGAAEDSDDDLGFRMFTGAEMTNGGGTSSGQGGNKPLKVTNLIDFTQCDRAEDSTSCGSTNTNNTATTARSATSAATTATGGPSLAADEFRQAEGSGVVASDSAIASAAAASIPGLSLAGDQDKVLQLQAENDALRAELDYMRQRLEDLKQETTIQVEIVRDDVAEKDAAIQELKKSEAALQDELSSLRRQAQEATTRPLDAVRLRAADTAAPARSSAVEAAEKTSDASAAAATSEVMAARAEAKAARQQAIQAIREVRGQAEQRLAWFLGRMKGAAEVDAQQQQPPCGASSATGDLSAATASSTPAVAVS